MESMNCDICFTAFSEKIYVPKILECGHTICLECLDVLLRGQKTCPTCMKTLSKSLAEYPSNFILLKNLTKSKENCFPNLLEINSLTDKFNLLLSKKESFKNSIEERISSLKNELVTSTSSLKNELIATTEQRFSSLKNEIGGKVENFEKLLHEELEISDADERKKFMDDIDHLNEMNKNLYCSCNRIERKMLHLSQYKNDIHFLYDLVVRLHNDEKIYACEVVGNEGWRYGEITFIENRLDIHCLSSTTIGNDDLVVSLGDIRKCIRSKEDILPFIQIGNEKLIFTLTDDLTPETLSLIKFFTGERGQTLKDIEVDVDKHYPETKSESGNNSFASLDLNMCKIQLPSLANGTGYEHALFKVREFSMTEGDVTLQFCNDKIFIVKVSALETIFCNVVGKLHIDCQFDFENMLNKKVEDSGISFYI